MRINTHARESRPRKRPHFRALSVVFFSSLSFFCACRGPSADINCAARRGDLVAVEECLAAGIAADSRNNRGRTPLQTAVMEWCRAGADGAGRYGEVAGALLAKGADPDARTADGETALHTVFLCVTEEEELAIDSGTCGANTLAALLLLLDQGADVNAPTRHGKTPLHYAVLRGDRRAADLLIARGADVIARDSSGTTPLHLAFSFWAIDSCNELYDYRGIVELLIARGADLTVCTDDGETMLHKVFARKNRYGEPRFVDRRGAPIVHPAIGQKFTLEAVRFLIARNADINAWSAGGRTPLHCAVFANDLASVTLLIEGGADVNARTDDGDTPLAAALGLGMKEMADLLRRKRRKGKTRRSSFL
jgi:ankyrin repeat protein